MATAALPWNKSFRTLPRPVGVLLRRHQRVREGGDPWMDLPCRSQVPAAYQVSSLVCAFLDATTVVLGSSGAFFFFFCDDETVSGGGGGYRIPPRKTAASYRADEWNVNKWAWEGALKVVSKGEDCIIKLEDKNTGELYARAFLKEGEPHPVEPVIDSSRYFVLRVEENIDGRQRHAFIGLGFRERSEAYDFQAALHDHMKYLNKKKAAEEMVQHYEKQSSVDYSLKEGETLVLQLKNKETGTKTKSAFFEQGLNKLSVSEKTNSKEAPVSLKLPPPPPSPVSPTDSGVAASPFKAEFPPQEPAAEPASATSALPSKAELSPEQPAAAEKVAVDDDFGDFQAAG